MFQVAARAGGEASAAQIKLMVQAQLGLKLESRKGRMEVRVIDSVSRPTEN